MKFYLLIICLAYFQISQGRPQEPQPTTPIPIISFTESTGDNGQFNYSYETGNGIKVQESAVLKRVTGLRTRSGNADGPDEENILVQSGSYSYTAPDGQIITLMYTADENGFQPVGAHLPTPPPIPYDIQKVLTQLAEADNHQHLPQEQ